MLPPEHPAGSDDRAADINCGSHGVLSKHVEESVICDMTIVDRHNEPGSKIARYACRHLRAQFIKRNERVDLLKMGQVPVHRFGTRAVIYKNTAAVLSQERMRESLRAAQAQCMPKAFLDST